MCSSWYSLLRKVTSPSYKGKGKMARKGLYTYKNIAQNYGSPQVNVQSSQTLQGRNYNPPPQVVVAPAVAIGMKSCADR
jgi:hypothetical protein